MRTTSFDPFDPVLRINPFPHLARLRGEAPVMRSPGGAWIVTRHADVIALLGNPAVDHWPWQPSAGGASRLSRVVGRWLELMSPVNRGRLRTLTASILSPGAIATLLPQLETEAAERVRALRGRRFDVVRQFAEPFTLGAVAAQLGISPLHRPRFAALAAPLRGSLFGLVRGHAADQAVEDLETFLSERLNEKRESPGDDLLTALLAAGADDEELVALALVLLVAGHENTANAIAGAIRLLGLNPEERERLAFDRTLLSSAIEELLRLDSPVQYVAVSLRDDVTIGDTTMQRGDAVLAALASANRDEVVFDECDRLDVGRTPNPHLALGHGPFFCIGAAAARAELRAAIGAVIAHAGPIRIHPATERWRTMPPVLRGLESLDVTFGRHPSRRPARGETATTQELAALRRDGFFTRAEYFRKHELDEIEAIADRAVEYHNGFPPHIADRYKEISRRDGITFVNELGDDSSAAPALLGFVLQPRLAALARSIAGDRAAHHCYQLVYKHPHFTQPFPWHQDHLHTPADHRFYNIWIALSDMTIANGCLWMLPSIGLDRILPYHMTAYGHSCWPLEGDDQGIPIELERGSIVVNTSWTLHKSGGNTTDQCRKAMLVAFIDDRAQAAGAPVRVLPYPSGNGEAA